MGATVTPEVIRERLRKFEVVAGDLDFLRAVARAQAWLAENPAPEGDSLPWVVEFCDVAIAMIDEALGEGTVDTLFAGGRKSASGLLVAINEMSNMSTAWNAELESEIRDLTETVSEE